MPLTATIREPMRRLAAAAGPATRMTTASRLRVRPKPSPPRRSVCVLVGRAGSCGGRALRQDECETATARRGKSSASGRAHRLRMAAEETCAAPGLPDILPTAPPMAEAMEERLPLPKIPSKMAKFHLKIDENRLKFQSEIFLPARGAWGLAGGELLPVRQESRRLLRRGNTAGAAG